MQQGAAIQHYLLHHVGLRVTLPIDPKEQFFVLLIKEKDPISKTK
jgi:hypothetical protein